MNDCYSVSKLVLEIKKALSDRFALVWVEGEVTNLSSSSAGHWYFSLSDEAALLNCALFKLDAFKNPLIREMKDGQKIRCYGEISLYPKRGTFQLIVKKIVPWGQGTLKEEYEKLKSKLTAEGLFDLERKRKIPLLPKRIGLITAKEGAAIQDFLTVLKRRSFHMDVLLAPALVQGEKAPESLRLALTKLIRYHLQVSPLDVIVLTRGGGSLEDLWAFNDEALIWELSNCPVPILSAIGHEVDFTLCDFVADKRAETPTAAAEILSEFQFGAFTQLKNLRMRLLQSLGKTLLTFTEILRRHGPRQVLDRIFQKILREQKRLGQLDPVGRRERLLPLSQFQRQLDDLGESLKDSLELKLKGQHDRLLHQQEMLRVLNPTNILARGYLILREGKTDKIIPSNQIYQELDQGTGVTLCFHDGKAVAFKGVSS